MVKCLMFFFIFTHYTSSFIFQNSNNYFLKTSKLLFEKRITNKKEHKMKNADNTDNEHYEKLLKQLNKDKTNLLKHIRENIPYAYSYYGDDDDNNYDDGDDGDDDYEYYLDGEDASDFLKKNIKKKKIEILIKPLNAEMNKNHNRYEDSDDDERDTFEGFKKHRKKLYGDNLGNENLGNEKNKNNEELKSDNFEIIKDFNFTFKDIGGYDDIKNEMKQCVDMLKNKEKYKKYNVRIPKGIILEGPPGNGKTLIARGFSGESKIPFISVSGSEFQNKYVGVGASRIRELFYLASKNIPCIIFIDEIDALGRKRSTDGEAASSERDSTLNELLVYLDGFKTQPGIFVIGATNRIDLLDPALLRPGRIDKKIFITLPDSKTRKEILNMHIKGKPYDNNINIEDLVVLTEGMSGAEIENLLNEAMLNALRNHRTKIVDDDLEIIHNKMIVGWQPNKHELTPTMIEQICVHEIGHVIVSLFCIKHPQLKKVILNLNSPTSPGYTLFEKQPILHKIEELEQHIMILLGGRIAEEIIYNNSVTTGASNDFKRALQLSQEMILDYGFGNTTIYSFNSDKKKEIIDNEIMNLIDSSLKKSKNILVENKNIIMVLAKELQKRKKMSYDDIIIFLNQILVFSLDD